MRWSAWVSMAAVVASAALGGAGASFRSSVVNQGYEEVVVGLSPLLDETQAEEIIAALKKALNETSQTLFKATGNRLYFRKVKILVPSTWSNVTVDQPASSESYENSDLRVDLKNPVYGDQVYTVQPGGCGEPGQYIHLTPTYLTNPAAEETWGPRGKVLAQAWARLRWGVFDEVGYPADERFPLFYRTWNELQDVVVRPNHCADEEISGRYVDLYTEGSCSYVDGVPDDNCRFVPDNQQTATSSLMSFTILDSIEKFCVGEGDAALSHNAEAPNRHNLMCEGRSVGAVMADHHDFLNATSLPAEYPVAPEVVVVQEVSAKFALVLDYSGSMAGQKIVNLANTAKRWLLHDVADGSFVTIIEFDTSANVLQPLTEISNSTRQDLANAITTVTRDSTCIGCGLIEALAQLEGQNNKVILLISDGEENVKPYIEDVMDDVVQSGARVVSIAYGTAAEEKMETLAQNTGGKAYIVPADDDGSFMDDAFQGSLTYQPGQSITSIDIQIYAEEVALNGTVANGTFTVDSTVGRNLEFRLGTSETIQSGSPYLTSPTGLSYTDVEFTSNINLWIITVDLAESGTWTWTMPVSPSSAIATVTVTAQARDPETLPILTESWMNTGVDYVNATYQPVIVYAKVTQGSKPVVGAMVRAYITTPDTSAAAVELDLLDNGKNADVQAGDGTYSRYFTQFVTTGRYAVKAQVWDEGSSYINNGFITSRRRSARSLSVPLAHARLAVSDQQLEVHEYCCGSVVPFDPDTATPTGEFTRTVAAGSFNVVELPVGGDAFPPARVVDLRTNAKDTITLTLNWTAPGDDYDAGTVSGYEIWMSESPTALTGNLNDSSTTSLLDYETSSNMTELLKEAGEEVTLELILEEPLEQEALYFVALRAVDDVGNRSPMSGQARLAAPTPPQHKDEGLEGWAIALIVVGCVVGVVLIAGVVYYVYKKNQ